MGTHCVRPTVDLISLCFTKGVGFLGPRGAPGPAGQFGLTGQTGQLVLSAVQSVIFVYSFY